MNAHLIEKIEANITEAMSALAQLKEELEHTQTNGDAALVHDNGRLTEAGVRELRSFYDSGMGIQDAADRLGISYHGARRRYRIWDEETKQDNGHLTESGIRELRACYDAGDSIGEAAEKLDISYTGAHRRYRAWDEEK